MMTQPYPVTGVFLIGYGVAMMLGSFRTLEVSSHSLTYFFTKNGSRFIEREPFLAFAPYNNHQLRETCQKVTVLSHFLADNPWCTYFYYHSQIALRQLLSGRKIGEHN
jgi:hypothetical protein